MAGVVVGKFGPTLALPAGTGNGAGLPVTDQALLSAGLLALLNADVILQPIVRPGPVGWGRVLTAGQDKRSSQNDSTIRRVGWALPPVRWRRTGMANLRSYCWTGAKRRSVGEPRRGNEC